MICSSLQIDHGVALHILVFIPVAILGILGGVFGAIFTFVNLKVGFASIFWLVFFLDVHLYYNNLASIPKVVASIPTVVRHIFSLLSVDMNSE